MWGRNTEKCLVFDVPHDILAIFEPVVGDFYEHFSSQGFFDSLVSAFSKVTLLNINCEKVYDLAETDSQIILEINRLLQTRPSPILVALDGGSGAGKSTLATILVHLGINNYAERALPL